MTRLKAVPPAQVDNPSAPTIQQIGAIKALSIGEASKHQQGLAWNFILRELAGVQLPSFRSGRPTDDMVFMEGRRFVGSQMLSIATLDTSKMKKDDE